MNEVEARDWLRGSFDVSRETEERLEAFVAYLLAESDHQNLISASTRDHVWARHIVDSAQLLCHLKAPCAAGSTWLDLGSGAGFPGLVAAILAPNTQFILVESRRKRIEFLKSAAEILGISDQVIVEGRRLETLQSFPADYISARAFAPLDRLLDLAARFSTSKTIWLLPKGRNARNELEAVSNAWQGAFHVEQSLTDADSSIIVAQNVKRGKA